MHASSHRTREAAAFGRTRCSGSSRAPASLTTIATSCEDAPRGADARARRLTRTQAEDVAAFLRAGADPNLLFNGTPALHMGALASSRARQRLG
jgi:hypothetical protein